jgi:hypothetical protein
MNMKTLLNFTVLLLMMGRVMAQDSSSKPLQISVYLEAYYGYDANKPANHTRPSFMYSYNRAQEFNVNLGFAKLSYSGSRIRGNFALAAGSYMNANYAGESGTLKNLYEASAGVKLARKANLWLDAGVFASHIGFESAVGKDCWTLTRSILADNTPYYETGLKLNYKSANGKWFLAALTINGWQHIQRPEGNSTPAFGAQVTYTPSTRATFNYSNFIGSEKPDTSKQMRYYHNLYAILNLTEHLGLIAGFDFGMEQSSKGSSSYNKIYAPLLLLKYNWGKNSIAARGEYYTDKNGVIINSGTKNGFEGFGWSVNADRKIMDNMLWRIEVRQFSGKDAYFVKADDFSKDYLFFTSSLAIAF